MIRAVALIVGAGILAAVAHVTIISTGGYGQPSAAMVIALASGVAVGAVAIGQALAHGRRVLAALMAIALLAGEAFGLLRTADMLVTARDAQQAPIREAMAKHKAAEARVAAAEASDAVKHAEAAKAEVDAKAMTASTAPACKQVCKDTLDKQVTAAARAVEDARAAAQAELAAARTDLASNPIPASATPLADRLGVPAWFLDLLLAGLGSIGCNGLAACLMAFAAHAGKTKSHPAQDGAADIKRDQTPTGNVAEYVVDRVQPSKGAKVAFRELYLGYVDWCRAKGALALAPTDFGECMAQLCAGTDVKSCGRGKDVYLTNIALTAPLAICAA